MLWDPLRGAPREPRGHASPPAIVPDQLLLGFRPEADDAARAAIVARHGGRVAGWLADLRVAVVELPPGRPLGVVAGEYAAEATVRYAEPNYLYHASGTPNDPRYGDGSLWGLSAIGAPAAWATTTGSSAATAGLSKPVARPSTTIARNIPGTVIQPPNVPSAR